MRLCLILLFLATTVLAQETPPSYDFVVLVDNSLSLSDRKGSIVSGVRELATSNFGRQIETGDTLHLWLCGRSEEEGLPSKEWDAEDSTYLGSEIAEHIRKTKFQRGTTLGPTLKQLAALAPQTTVLLAVILTDGEEPITGFSFANEINRELPRIRREGSRLKRPVQISLLAREGQWTDWRLTVGADPRYLCRVPARPKTPPPAPAPAPAPVAAPLVAEEKLAPLETETPSILNYPPGAKIVATVAETPAPTLPAPPATRVETNPPASAPVALAKIEAAPPTPIDPQPKPPLPEPAVLAVTEAPRTPIPPAPPATPAAEKPALEMIGVPELQGPPLPPLLAPQPSFHTELPLPVIFGGIAGVCLVLAGATLLKRGSSSATPKQTFISQSLAK